MSLPAPEHIDRDGFRLRGVDMTRVDAFSDVVFGFALTLLVVSLQVPKTYAELHASLRGFLPFAISFALLMTIWFAHFKFFRRFGTHDAGTIVINSTLLFVVLFYVYPLKFLFTIVGSGLIGVAENSVGTDRQFKELMSLYGLGFAAIYALLAALYWNGLRQRQGLHLSRLEELLTRGYIVGRLLVGGIGLLSAAVAFVLPVGEAGRAGYVYLLTLLVRPVFRRVTARRVERFHALNKLTASPQPVVLEPL